VKLIEIDEVTAVGDVADHLAGASVEIPAAGTRRDEWSIAVSGWVVGRNEPVTTVEVVQQAARVASAPVEIARADVTEAHPGRPGSERAGFDLRIGGVWLPENFVLRLEAGFANGHRVPFALIRGRAAAISTAPASGSLQPISVTSLPRSGATLVMQMLAAHPEVVVAGDHPYSARPAAYWAHMLRVLSSPRDLRHSSHPDTFDVDLNWIGSHPFNGPPLSNSPEVRSWLGCAYVEELGSFASRSASDLYAQVAVAQGVQAPRYYAEKREPGPIARLTARLDPRAHEILVVRDPRDMACSMLAFARKTGAEARSDVEFALSLVPALARLVSYAHERGSAALMVRYEDLVGEPAATLAQILDHLSLEADRRSLRAIAADATAETPELLDHRTSSDATASVGRHAQEMDGEALEAVEESFGPALDAFGYGRAASAAVA
jgi:Sulfotransferase family